MSQARRTGLWQLAAVAAVLAVAGRVSAQAPNVGDVQRLTVITVSMQVGGAEKEIKQVTYTPPPGWYVRSHTVECVRQTGHSSFAVSTVPREWSWTSEEKVRDTYKALLDLAAKAQDRGLQAELQTEQEQRLSELRKVSVSHHALVVDATARGEGFLRGGGSLELTVTAELVYLGTDEGLARMAERRRARIVGIEDR